MTFSLLESQNDLLGQHSQCEKEIIRLLLLDFYVFFMQLLEILNILFEKCDF